MLLWREFLDISQCFHESSCKLKVLTHQIFCWKQVFIFWCAFPYSCNESCLCEQMVWKWRLNILFMNFILSLMLWNFNRASLWAIGESVLQKSSGLLGLSYFSFVYLKLFCRISVPNLGISIKFWFTQPARYLAAKMILTVDNAKPKFLIKFFIFFSSSHFMILVHVSVHTYLKVFFKVNNTLLSSLIAVTIL